MCLDLCSRCSQIDFRALAHPTLADVRIAQQRQRRSTRLHVKMLPQATWYGPESETPADPEKINLGSFQRIEQGSANCPLCSVILETLRRRGVTRSWGGTLPEGSEIQFLANPDTSYYGYTTDSLLDGESKWNEAYFILRRLKLNVRRYDADSNYEFLGSLNNVLQPCNFHGLESPKTRDEMIFCGRRRPLVIDVSLLQYWIELCTQEHHVSCETEDQVDETSFKLIRLIDTTSQCIRTFNNYRPKDRKYIAPSYVWGCNQEVKLLSHNKDELQRSGALSIETIPKTIADAIEIARLLSISFLWVDALCIVQDDDDDKKDQIGNMANIYGSAFLTIIAASGGDCHSGLPGLRPGSRDFEQREVVVIPPTSNQIGLALSTTCQSEQVALDEFQHPEEFVDIDRSVWNSRGWTLQERALSRRNLIFTRQQVMWACDGSYFCEESYFEHLRPDSDLGRKPTTSLGSTPLRFGLFGELNAITMYSINGQMAQISTSERHFWAKYRWLVKNLSKRNLSVQGDIHDAFQGIADALHQLRGEWFHWGHPLSRFERSLCWTSFHGLYRRKERSTLKMTSINDHVEFPSWSWMGWRGEADLTVGLDTHTPEIVCFVHHCDVNRSGQLRFTPISQVMESNTRFDSKKSEELEKFNSDEPLPPWKERDGYAVDLQQVEAEIPGLTESKLRRVPDRHILFFWSSTASFHVDKAVGFGGEVLTFQEHAERKNPSIRDQNGKPVGTVRWMNPVHWADMSEVSGHCEFVAVGRRHIPELPDLPAEVLALQIRWRDGTAERVNTGEINEQAWIMAAPKWKLVALK